MHQLGHGPDHLRGAAAMAQHAVRPGAHHHVCRSPSSSAVVMHDLSSALVWSWQLNVRFSRILYSQSLPPTNFKLVSIRWTRIHIRSKFALTPCCIAMRATDTPGCMHRRTSSCLTCGSYWQRPSRLCPTTNPVSTSEVFCVACVHAVYVDTSFCEIGSER